MQELLSNLAEALRPMEAADFRQAAPEVQEPASAAATQKDAAEQPSAAAEDAAQAAKPDEQAGSTSAAKEGANSEQSQQKPQAEMRSAPSAAEKLEQEINATAEQVGHVYTESWSRAMAAGLPGTLSLLLTSAACFVGQEGTGGQRRSS